MPSGSVLSKKNGVTRSVTEPKASATNWGPKAEPPMPTTSKFENNSPYSPRTFPLWTSAANRRIRARVSSMARRSSRDGANDGVRSLSDINGREFLVLALLAVAVLWMGIHPKPVTDLMNASVAELLRHVAVSKLQ